MLHGIARLATRPTQSILVLTSLDKCVLSLDAGSHWLDDHDRQRYYRFTNPETAHCFLTGRTIVKQFIADQLRQDPQQIRLVLSDQGKPELAPRTAGANRPVVHFSISHKLSRLVIGFSWSPLGIDYEPLILANKMKIARRFFTQIEVAHLESLNPLDRDGYFTKIWVLKEAEVKRQGSSLASILGSIGFTVDAGHIQCHGHADSVFYQLLRVDDPRWAGEFAVATTAPTPVLETLLFQGAPELGYAPVACEQIALSVP